MCSAVITPSSTNWKVDNCSTGKLYEDNILKNKYIIHITTVVYPKLSIDFKFNKDIKIDERSIKAIAQLAIRGKQLLDADIALVFAPVDASNIYEITAKVNHAELIEECDCLKSII